MPIRALLNGKTFWAEKLQEIHRNLPFKCPGCKEDMLIVLPRISNRIKHFRHKSGRVHGEPETQEHLQTKVWFKNNFDNVELEYYMKENDEIHILDVLISLEQEFKIGIECQYSSISIESVMKRNLFYLNNNITPIWVFIKGDTYDPWKYTDEHYHDSSLQRIKKVERYILQKYYKLYYFDGNDIYHGKFYRRPDIYTAVWGRSATISKGWFETEKLSCEELKNELHRVQDIPIDKIKHTLSQKLLKEINARKALHIYKTGGVSREFLEKFLDRVYRKKDVERLLRRIDVNLLRRIDIEESTINEELRKQVEELT